MVDPVTVATIVVAGVASLFMAWSIGAGSSGSTPFAPAVGANAISVMRAAFFVGLLGLAGAVLQGANVTEAVGRELVRGVAISPLAATIGLLVAAGLVAAGVFAGYPIATAFTVTGAIVGVGLGAGGDPAWAKYQEIAGLWVMTPIAGGGVAYLLSAALRRDATVKYVIPTLGGITAVIVVNIEIGLLGPPGEQETVAGATATALATTVGIGETVATAAVSITMAAVAFTALARSLAHDPVSGQQRFLLVLGGLVAFSAGGSQVGLAIGPLVPLLGQLPLGNSIAPVLFGGGVGLLIGSWTGAPRMIKALAQDYASLDPRRSIAALVPAFVIAQTAVLYGIPVSFNEIIVSTIVGAGYGSGERNLSQRKMIYTILAWIGSLVLAFALSYGIYRSVTAVLP